MASLAASPVGMSELLGTPLSKSNFSGAARSAPTATTPATFKTVALFGKKKAAPAKAKAAAVPESDELSKWYGKYDQLTEHHFN